MCVGPMAASILDAVDADERSLASRTATDTTSVSVRELGLIVVCDRAPGREGDGRSGSAQYFITW